MAISIIDVEFEHHLRWNPALRAHRSTVRRLLAAFNSEATKFVGKRMLSALKSAVDVGNRLLGGAYRDEMEEIAEAADVSLPDVLAANLAYDTATVGGCTTLLTNNLHGAPLHSRNLDWQFPRLLLRDHTCVFRIHGAPAGDYLAVGWPGLFGVLTALKPFKFSITVNFVQNSAYTSRVKFALRAVRGYWPATWVTRQVMDEANSFNQARRIMKRSPVLSPILFAVAGAAKDEAVVIERSPDEYAERRMQSGSECHLTNHYVSEEFEEENADLDGSDTKQRHSFVSRALARQPVRTATDAFKLLSRATLLSEITQHQVSMCPANGEMVVRVPGRPPQTVSSR